MTSTALHWDEQLAANSGRATASWEFVDVVSSVSRVADAVGLKMSECLHSMRIHSCCEVFHATFTFQRPQIHFADKERENIRYLDYTKTIHQQPFRETVRDL